MAKKEDQLNSRQERARNLVNSSFSEARSYQQPWFTKFTRWYELYRSFQSRKNYEGKSNLFIPVTFWTIEATIPNLTLGKPKLRVLPREEGDVSRAEAINSLLDYQWDEIGMQEKLEMWVRNTLIYGTGISKLSWQFDRQNELDAPHVDIVDILDFYIDPNATSIEDAEWVIHRTQQRMDQIQSNPNFDQLEVKKLKSGTKGVTVDQYKEQKRAAIDGSSASQIQKKGMVELKEYWGLFDLEDDGEKKEYIITIANDQYVLRMEENPFAQFLSQPKPFFIMRDVKIPHEFYGVGMVEPMERLQEELNDTRNQRMDNVTLVLNRMWQVVRGADIDENELISRPGGIIHTNIPNGATPLPTADMTRSSYEEESIIKGDIQQASGVSGFESGAPAGPELSVDTATGVRAVVERASVRFRAKIQSMELALRSFMKGLIQFDQYFIDHEKIIRLEGDMGIEFTRLTPEEIRGNFDVFIEAGSSQPISQILKRQEAMQLFQILALAPEVNRQKLIQELLDAFGIKNKKEYLAQQQPQVGFPGLAGVSPQPGTQGLLQAPPPPQPPQPGVESAEMMAGVVG